MIDWNKLRELQQSDKYPPMVQCLECGMFEREEWAVDGNHKCNYVTDVAMPAVDDGRTWRIGKRRFIKFVKNA